MAYVFVLQAAHRSTCTPCTRRWPLRRHALAQSLKRCYNLYLAWNYFLFFRCFFFYLWFACLHIWHQWSVIKCWYDTTVTQGHDIPSSMKRDKYLFPVYKHLSIGVWAAKEKNYGVKQNANDKEQSGIPSRTKATFSHVNKFFKKLFLISLCSSHSLTHNVCI